MTNAKTTRRSLLLSVLSLVLCCTMLLGTTYAWFTDTVTSGVNQIVAGNLDIELVDGNGDTIEGHTALFEEVDLWEPGAVAWENLTVKNVGALALKYTLSINFTNENTLNGNGLSQILKVAVVEEIAKDATREAVLKAAKESGEPLTDFSLTGKIEAGADDVTYGIVIYWEPSDNDNLYNVNNGQKTDDGKNALSIDLGIKLFATQDTVEKDSFDDQYDAEAPLITVEVTPANVQAYLDGEYGSISNKKLVLTAGNYDTLVLGRATKYAGSNTEYICDTHDFATADAEEFKAHLANGEYHTTPKYVTTLENLQITVKEGDTVTVAGILASSGHMYGEVYDYVRDIQYSIGSAYYSTLLMNNVKFEGISFVGISDFKTSDADTVIDGVTFESCTFNGSYSTTASKDAAIHYYNEANNGNVKNLTVVNCSFNDWYQGVYTHHVRGISVSNSSFNKTGHNAIAIQCHGEKYGATNHGSVEITNNTFTEIQDRIIRFNEIAAGTQITIKYNMAKNSGDTDGEVIKATSIATGVTFDVSYNDWGSNAVIANDQFKNANENAVVSATSAEEASTAIENGATDIILTAGTYTIPGAAKNSETLTIVGAGNGDTEVEINGNVRSLVLKNLTVVGDSADSLNVAADQKMVCENVVFQNTLGMTAQGVVNGTMSFTNCTFEAGFHIDSSEETASVTFNSCTFTEYSYIKLGGSAAYEMNDCVVNTLASDATGPWGRQWLITYNDITLNNCTLGRVIRAGGSVNINLNSCVDQNGDPVTTAIVYDYNSPIVTIK